MLTVTLTLVTAFVGGLAGAFLGAYLLRRLLADEQIRPVMQVIDPLTAAEIDQLANSWAAAHGQPAAAGGLLADKLRLAFTLRPKPQHRNRWRR
jgi:hypothetical protein